MMSMMKNQIVYISYDLCEGGIIEGVGTIYGKYEELPGYSDGMLVVYFPDGSTLDDAYEFYLSDEWYEAANELLLDNQIVEYTYDEFSKIVAA